MYSVYHIKEEWKQLLGFSRYWIIAGEAQLQAGKMHTHSCILCYRLSRSCLIPCMEYFIFTHKINAQLNHLSCCLVHNTRSPIPHYNAAFTGHAGSEWVVGRGRYGVVQAGPCDRIYRERGVKEKNQLGRSVFVSG